MKHIISRLTSVLIIAVLCLVSGADCLGQGVVTRPVRPTQPPPVKTTTVDSSINSNRPKVDPQKKKEDKRKGDNTPSIVESTDSVTSPSTDNTITSSTGNAVIDRLVANMVYVEGGTFMMGSNDSEAQSNEKPIHQETVTSFYIGKYEVTQAEWEAVMGSNPSHFKGDNKPAECVSWDDCQEFITKLNQLTGKNFRLPTEAEWEFAARGGKNSRGYKYSGSDDNVYVAWSNGDYDSGTHNVGIKQTNELGLHDMSGNVWEWTADKWCDDYNSARGVGDYGSYHVFRGGGYNSFAFECTVSSRDFKTTRARLRFSSKKFCYDSSVGLRLALSL